MKSDNPKISVIVPVYNTEKYLKRCIDSILNQTFTDFEVLLINDGSTDSSGAICDEYAKKDSRVRVFHKENGGVSSARNLGLRSFFGEWVMFIDSDDFISLDYFIIMYYTVIKYNIKILFSHLILDDGIVKTYKKRDALNYLIEGEIPTSLWLGIYHNEILQEEFLNENIHFFEDLEFQYRLIAKVEYVGVINRSFYFYEKREGSANNSVFNEKILSCLLIPDSLKNVLGSNQQYEDLSVLVLKQTFFYLLKSDKVESKYYSIIQQKIKDTFPIWFKSRKISRKVKLLFYLSLISVDKVCDYFRYYYRRHIGWEV